MTDLLDKKFSILNPLINNFVKINQIFFSKTFAIYQPISAIDPNRAINDRKLANAKKPRVSVKQSYEENYGQSNRVQEHKTDPNKLTNINE